MPRIKKNREGYGYNYVDINAINDWLAEQGISYRQSIQVIEGHDYILTTVFEPEKEPYVVLGCRVPEGPILSGKTNAAQTLGSALTYARRYSLMMAFGLGAADDDGESLTVKIPEDKETLIKDIKAICVGNNSKASVLRVMIAQLGREGAKLAELEVEDLQAIYPKICS